MTPWCSAGKPLVGLFSTSSLGAGLLTTRHSASRCMLMPGGCGSNPLSRADEVHRRLNTPSCRLSPWNAEIASRSYAKKVEENKLYSACRVKFYPRWGGFMQAHTDHIGGGQPGQDRG